jgi:hypothetical protein
MSQLSWGKGLITFAAAVTITVPVLVDGVLLYGAHIGSPAWPGHAKLHGVISFAGVIGLGIAALVLSTRSGRDSALLTLAAFCAAFPWIGLIAAGYFPGADYGFAGDPQNYVAPPVIAGIKFYANVAISVVLIAISVLGLLLARAAKQKPDADFSR